jgi:hypothetical protein
METAQSLSKTWPLFAGGGLALGMGSFDGASVQGIFPYVAGGLSTSSDHALWTLTYFIVHWSLGITLMPWTTARFGMRRVFQGRSPWLWWAPSSVWRPIISGLCCCPALYKV